LVASRIGVFGLFGVGYLSLASPRMWPYSRERTTDAVRRNRKNGFHKICFFQSVKLPFFRLQRTQGRFDAARGLKPG
jgi:hypothetical protein